MGLARLLPPAAQLSVSDVLWERLHQVGRCGEVEEEEGVPLRCRRIALCTSIPYLRAWGKWA